MEEKKIKGRKRHISVDVLGLLLCISVHSAGISDREGAKLVIARTLAVCPTIQLFWADGGYTGKLVTWVMLFFQRTLEIIKRPKGMFKVVQWRWIVERTFGWLNCYRRLSKDYERTTFSSEAWVKISMINLMLHRLEPGYQLLGHPLSHSSASSIMLSNSHILSSRVCQSMHFLL